jgi:hypothetical protein
MYSRLHTGVRKPRDHCVTVGCANREDMVDVARILHLRGQSHVEVGELANIA